MSTLIKLQKVIPVVNHFIDAVPDVPHNTVQQFGDYFYVRKPYSVLIFSKYQDAFESNQIKYSCAMVNYGKTAMRISCINDYFDSKTASSFSITETNVYFHDLVMDINVTKDEYFSNSLGNDIFLTYEEFKVLFTIKSPGATINIKNL